jgi:orotate phosphoribosyltransferase
LSHPTIRTYIRQQLSTIIQEKFGSVGCIAGVATAGIPQGVLVAQELGLPFIYVRAKPKDHGTGNMIEGDILTGKRVVVVEDLISTGKSSLQAVSALRDAGYDVAGLAAIFSYGFDIATENFKSANCPFITLSNYSALLSYAAEHQYITRKDVEVLREWRVDPSKWGA